MLWQQKHQENVLQYFSIFKSKHNFEQKNVTLTSGISTLSASDTRKKNVNEDTTLMEMKKMSADLN